MSRDGHRKHRHAAIHRRYANQRDEEKMLDREVFDDTGIFRTIGATFNEKLAVKLTALADRCNRSELLHEKLRSLGCRVPKQSRRFTWLLRAVLKYREI